MLHRVSQDKIASAFLGWKVLLLPLSSCHRASNGRRALASGTCLIEVHAGAESNPVVEKELDTLPGSIIC